MAVPGTAPHRQCGTMIAHNRLIEEHPEFRLRQMDIEMSVLRRSMEGAEERAGIATIPTVVHVLHRLPAEKISTGQVRSQIRAMNRDFRATNPDRSKTPTTWKGFVSDARLKFALATEDPYGRRTNGIVYVKTERTSFGTNDSMKFKASGGADAWPTDRYLNIWVCTLSGGLLGYAQFPGGPAETDGVVVRNTGFGTMGTAAPPFNLGRTTTHEIGHWLNLRHIWGDTPDCSGSDEVDDTPNAAGPNFGKPTFPHVSCGNAPNGDMFMNYMDYVDDDSMVMFTPQQVTRMNATLEGPRSSFLN